LPFSPEAKSRGCTIASHLMSMTNFVPRPAEGLGYPNLVRMFEARVERSAHLPALRHKESGAWRTLTWRQWWVAARELAAGMRRELGLARGDTVGIVAETRLEWILCDLALAMAGAISVPIYPSLTPEHVNYILGDAGCVALFVDSTRRLEGLARPGSGKLEALRDIVSFDEPPADGPDRVSSFRQLIRAGAKVLADDVTMGAALDELAGDLALGDPFTHVYTSGTTGVPKGVELTHKNLVYEAWAIKNVVPVDDTDEQLLVLPLAHIFARHMVWGAVEQGAVTAIGEGEAHIEANMREVAPTFVAAVPRMYERAYHGIMRQVVGRTPLTKTAFSVSLEVGRKMSGYRQRGQVPPTSLTVRHAVADRMFFSRIRAHFGGRLRFFVCGGARLSKEIAEFFHACGLLILEGYGLTETTGATNVNRPDRFRFGTVGPAMPGCEIRIAEDGEVLVRGHNIMARYHGLPEETAAAFDEHGWFRTGDIGELVDGFLRITDRKKDLLKTASGKYIAPRVIEGRLEVREGISHAVVFGDGRPRPVLLVTIDEEPMMRLSEREGLGCRTYADLVVHPRIRQVVQGHVDAVNATLARHEIIRRFDILPEEFTVQNGQLTPTRKVRRKVVQDRWTDRIERMYPDDPAAEIRRGARAS
jgi:long-chain acyl-CoA synthetase